MPDSDITLAPPLPGDGAALWSLAAASGKLDLNSSYAYLLWCRDFAATSVVARTSDGAVVGYVTGYVRPDDADTYFVWQVAVDTSQRGRGIAGSMLDDVLERVTSRGIRHLETTVTLDNAASLALFERASQRWGAQVHRSVLFDTEAFPDAHDAEMLLRIGPLQPN